MKLEQCDTMQDVLDWLDGEHECKDWYGGGYDSVKAEKALGRVYELGVRDTIEQYAHQDNQ